MCVCVSVCLSVSVPSLGRWRQQLFMGPKAEATKTPGLASLWLYSCLALLSGSFSKVCRLSSRAQPYLHRNLQSGGKAGRFLLSKSGVTGSGGLPLLTCWPHWDSGWPGSREHPWWSSSSASSPSQDRGKRMCCSPEFYHVTYAQRKSYCLGQLACQKVSQILINIYYPKLPQTRGHVAYFVPQNLIFPNNLTKCLIFKNHISKLLFQRA